MKRRERIKITPIDLREVCLKNAADFPLRVSGLPVSVAALADSGFCCFISTSGRHGTKTKVVFKKDKNNLRFYVPHTFDYDDVAEIFSFLSSYYIGGICSVAEDCRAAKPLNSEEMLNTLVNEAEELLRERNKKTKQKKKIGNVVHLQDRVAQIRKKYSTSGGAIVAEVKLR